MISRLKCAICLGLWRGQKSSSYISSTLNLPKNISRIMRALEIAIVELQGLTEFTHKIKGIVKLSNPKIALTAGLLGHKAQGTLVHPCFQSIKQMDIPSKFYF